MNYGQTMPTGSIGAGLGSSGQYISPVQGRTPSMEERLDFLSQGVDRLFNAHRRLNAICDRLIITPENSCATPCPPPSNDLSGRFGDAIASVHAQVTEIEKYIGRIESALFDEKACKAAQAECVKGR